MKGEIIMTKREAAVISAYTGMLIGEFEDFHAYAEEVMGRPIFTHEFPSIAEELKEKSKSDFMSIKITDSKEGNEWMYHMPMEDFGPINFKAVERALGFRLFAWQKSYILFGKYRKSGETTAHILKVLLTGIDSKPLDYSNLARMDRRGRIYVQQTRDIWEKLRDAKIKMRPVLWNKRDKEMYEKQIRKG